MNYISERHRKGRVWLKPQRLGFGGKRGGALCSQPEWGQALAGTQTHKHGGAGRWFLSLR